MGKVQHPPESPEASQVLSAGDIVGFLTVVALCEGFESSFLYGPGDDSVQEEADCSYCYLEEHHVDDAVK